MKTYMEEAKEIPVTKETDVLVVGGGYAGFGAAWAAAQTGAKTLLIEQQSCLGGLVTMGLVSLTFSYIEGVGYEVFSRLRRENALKGRFIDPEKTKIILEDILLEANVKLLYNTTVIDSIVENQVIKGVVVWNKAGRQAIMAKQVIDASGDGDVAAYAGVPYEVGCPELNNYNQATSLVCRIGNVDYECYRNAKANKDGDDQRTGGYFGSIDWWESKLKESVSKGEFPYVIDKRINWIVVIPGRDLHHQELCICYAHSRKCRCLDQEDITRQLIEQRKQNCWFLKFLRANVPGFENAWLIDTAPMLGVRDSRRIMCEYKLTAEDILDCRKFPDVIARGNHHLDAHHPTEPGHIKHILRRKPEGTQEKAYVNPGDWRDIPYRVLVTQKIDNLLVAGRNFSADFMAQSGNRLVLECLNMGQAAGAAAALAIRDHTTPRRLSVDKLQKRLGELNINIVKDPKYGEGWVTSKVKEKDLLRPEDDAFGRQATTIIKDEARSKYRNYMEGEEDDLISDYDKSKGGYTGTGGDVGTNLE
jgi:hypothetical protein